MTGLPSQPASPVPEEENASRLAGGAVDLAVVIVNYRCAEDTVACLDKVFAHADGLRLEVVVVDNCSGDGSPRLIAEAHPTVRVIERDHNGGFAAGVNEGFAATRAPFVLLLNPDAELLPGALAALFAHLRRQPRTAVVAPIVVRPDGTPAPNGYRRFPGPFLVGFDVCVLPGYLFALAPRLHPYAISIGELEAGVEPAWVSGSALLARREAYLQAGPFDEGFFLYFEELEWQERLRKLGWGVAVEPRARVVHRVRGGGAESYVHSPHWVRSAIYYLTEIKGHRFAWAKLAVGTGLALSWLTAACLRRLPIGRIQVRAAAQAAGYRKLLRFLAQEVSRDARHRGGSSPQSGSLPDASCDAKPGG